MEVGGKAVGKIVMELFHEKVKAKNLPFPIFFSC